MNSKAADYRAWASKAQNDLQNIANNLSSDIIPWDTVCFHAQQAAEKLLKAFLVFHNQNPPRTHDLVVLLDNCIHFDSTLADIEDDLQILHSFAVDARYPGDFYEAEEEDGRTAYAAAKRIQQAINGRLTG